MNYPVKKILKNMNGSKSGARTRESSSISVLPEQEVSRYK